MESDAGTCLVLLGFTCEEPAPVSGETLDPTFFVSLLFPPLTSLLLLQVQGGSCQHLLILRKGLKHFIKLCKYIRSGFPLFICL